MIISHRYRFIFLKTRKTAGTSIEIALAALCGDEDVITPITPEDEAIRKGLGYRGPQNYQLPLLKYRLRDWTNHLVGRKRAGYRYYNHMPAEEIRSVIGAEIWGQYFKFCFERNPWDKAVSLYFWKTRRRHCRPSFRDFLRSTKLGSLSNFSIYGIGGEVVVDHVGMYESLGAELERISAHLRFSEEIRLPRAKTTVREDRRHYREIVGQAEQQIIVQACAREIAYFGFRF